MTQSDQGYLGTVFVRIVAAATINFNLARVRLLIEGGSYSRAAVINFGGYCVVPSVKTVTEKVCLRRLCFKQSRNTQKMSGHATIE